MAKNFAIENIRIHRAFFILPTLDDTVIIWYSDVSVVYEHLQEINLQRASLYVPPLRKFRQPAANSASGFAENGTCSL